MEEFLLILLDKYLAWVLLKPIITFLNFFGIQMVVKSADKICQYLLSN